jgi:NDP-sugar pyrophosphorylase family protein
MKVVIMAGGKGERLRPYTAVIPKPLLPLGDKPILELLLDKLKEKNIEEIIMLTNYKSEYFKLLFGEQKDGIKISYSEESLPLGTAGPLGLIKEKINSDFIVMNGDILTDIDVNDLINFHKENSPDITVVTKEETITLRYGIINVENEEVKGWQEKPTITSEISAGIYMLNPKVLELIKEKEKVDMNELIIRVLENGGKVKRLLYKGRWIDIGKIEDYENAQKEIVGQFENE